MEDEENVVCRVVAQMVGNIVGTAEGGARGAPQLARHNQRAAWIQEGGATLSLW